VLIAPDKFKGTMTAREAARAMALGVRDACAVRGVLAEFDQCPVADGGEGTIDAITEAGVVFNLWAEGAWGPRGALDPDFPGAEWIIIDRMQTHIIESARFIGLQLVAPEDRHPLLMTSAGLGSVIRHASSMAPKQIVVGLGGSATVDGGLGAAWADSRARPIYRPGYRPFGQADSHGCRMPYAIDLGAIESIEVLHRDRPQVKFVALCDVDNPLLGANGAARVYGPQKGATPEEVEQLEQGLENLVRVCRRAGIEADPDTPGAGAAGGLGYGMMAFFGAKLVSGAEYVLDMIGFDARVQAADVVITGEGRLDAQTSHGKAAAVVARRAMKVGREVLCVAGSIERGAGHRFSVACSLEEAAPFPAAAMGEAPKFARLAAAQAVGEWLDAGGGRGG